MALIRVKPSPRSPMFKSASKTSNDSRLMYASASGTVAATDTSKPCICRMAGRVMRIAGSSSANKILVLRVSIFVFRLSGAADEVDAQAGDNRSRGEEHGAPWLISDHWLRAGCPASEKCFAGDWQYLVSC